MIVCKINVSKIAKEKMFKGDKGTYLDVVLIETPDDQYGNDYMVVQGVSKEDREAGVKGAILGNGKIIQRRDERRPPQQTAREQIRQKTGAPPPEDGEDQVPF